ncbi:MAG: hypothetical protein ABH879_09245 [archaeon]
MATEQITLAEVLFFIENELPNPIVQIGYPNLDLETRLDEATITGNPGFFDVRDNNLVVRGGQNLWLRASRDYAAITAFSDIMPSGGDYTIPAGKKVSFDNRIWDAPSRPPGSIELRCSERWGGGMMQAERAISEMLSDFRRDYTAQFLYHHSAVGPAEAGMNKYLRSLGITPATYVKRDLDPRVNVVVMSARGPDGYVEDKVIGKHPFQAYNIEEEEFHAMMDGAFRGKTGTLFDNGVKYDFEIAHAVSYALEHGLHMVSVISDSTAKHKKLVRERLIPNSTYLGNEEEIGVITGATTVERYKHEKKINLGGCLDAICTLREWQGDTPQNMYPTLGELGSISVDRDGDITWMSGYGSAYLGREPNTNGFGDTFAATVALMENLGTAGYHFSAAEIQKVATAVVGSKKRSRCNQIDAKDVDDLITNNEIKIVKLGRIEYNPVTHSAVIDADQPGLGRVKAYFDSF